MTVKKRLMAFSVVAGLAATVALTGPANLAYAADPCEAYDESSLRTCAADSAYDTIKLTSDFTISDTASGPVVITTAKTIYGNNKTITVNIQKQAFTWDLTPTSSTNAVITFKDLTLISGSNNVSLLNFYGNPNKIPNSTVVNLSNVKFDMTANDTAWAVMVVQGVSQLNFQNGCQISTKPNAAIINYDINKKADADKNVLTVDFSGLTQVNGPQMVMYADNETLSKIQVDPTTIGDQLSNVDAFFVQKNPTDNTEIQNVWATATEAMLDDTLGAMSQGSAENPVGGTSSYCTLTYTIQAPKGSTVALDKVASQIFKCGTEPTIPKDARPVDSTGKMIFTGWTIDEAGTWGLNQPGDVIEDPTVIRNNIQLFGQWGAPTGQINLQTYGYPQVSADGSQITFRYVLHNAGNVPITSVNLTVPGVDGSQVSCEATSLYPFAASVICSVKYSVQAQDRCKVVAITGTAQGTALDSTIKSSPVAQAFDLNLPYLGCDASSGNTGSTGNPGGSGNPGGQSNTGTTSTTGSQVTVDKTASSVTGGAARVADGDDAYTVNVDLGRTGMASSLTIAPQDGISLDSVTDLGGGNYELSITADTPGIYQVNVLVNGTSLGKPVTINFIGASVSTDTIAIAGTLTLTGAGFLPGEQVTVTVHSTPVQVGQFKADKTGTVTAAFTIPKGFALGDHTATFAGDKSGTVSAPFTVTFLASTGGHVAPVYPGAWSGLLVMVGLSLGVLIWRRNRLLAS